VSPRNVIAAMTDQTQAMVIQYIERKLIEKSKAHRAELKKLGQSSEDDPLSDKVLLLEQTSQLRGMNTIIQDIDASAEDFIFYFDRLATILVEQCVHGLWSGTLKPLANDSKCHE
jgi:uridine kinase